MKSGEAGRPSSGWIRLAAAAVLLLVAAVASVGAAPAAAKPPKPTATTAGRLDPRFGKDGKVSIGFPAGNTGSPGPQYTLPFSFFPGHLEMAKAPGGKIVVAGSTKMVRFLADGKLDKSFGSGGVVKVEHQPGSVFVLAAVGVDSAGRTVLAGVTRPVVPDSTPDPLLSSAEVMRFDASGNLDPSFGSGGVLVTDFGQPAPKAAGGRYPGDSVGIADLAIDSGDRILLTGGVVTATGGCTRDVDSEGFVTRLTESGAVDPTFGFHLVEGLPRLGQVEGRPDGYLALASGEPTCTGEEGPASVLIGIEPGGNLDSSFGSFGFRTVEFAFPPAMAVTPAGKILLLGHPYTIKIGKGKKRHRVPVQTIDQLLPSGAADPSFKRIGQVNIFLPKNGSLSTLAVDPSGRIIVAGELTKRVSKSPKNRLRRSLFLVSRLNADGSNDPTFGSHGSLTTSFGGPTDSFATQVLPVGKKILVGGGISGPEFGSGGGFAIARYLGG